MKQSHDNGRDVSQTASSTSSPPKDRLSLLVLLSFASFFLYSLIVWYLTSRVDRQSLPDIDHLKSYQSYVTQPVFVHIIRCHETSAHRALSTAPLVRRLSERALPIIREWNVTVRYSDETALCNVTDEAMNVAAVSSWHYESAVDALPPLHFFIISGGVVVGRGSRWVMGTADAGWFRCHVECDTDDAFHKLELLLVDLAAMLHVDKDAADEIVVKPNAQVHFSFTLLTAQYESAQYINASTSQSHVDSWDITTIEDIITTLIARLSAVVPISWDLQVVGFAELASKAVRVSFADSEAYVISESDLSNFVGNTLWNVKSPLITNMTVMEFVFYKPPTSRRPLLIGYPIDGDAIGFIVPSWGAVVIDNQDNDDATVVMQHWIMQIRRMFKLSDQLHTLTDDNTHHNRGNTNSDDAYILIATEENILSDWEMSLLNARYVIANVRHSIETLSALYGLVDEVTQMPVTKDIASVATSAIDDVQTAITHCRYGQWTLAAQPARSARTAVDFAFYHPDMLPALYFSDEHTYAVYAPFFLPILLPVAYAAIRRIRSR